MKIENHKFDKEPQRPEREKRIFTMDDYLEKQPLFYQEGGSLWSAGERKLWPLIKAESEK